MCKHFMLLGVAGIAAMSLLSCKKDQTQPQERLTTQSPTAVAAAATTGDELDAILKDLSPDTYLLTFEGLPQNPYITKSIYGNRSEETQYAGNPAPALVKIGYNNAAWKKIWIKTCPTMIPILDVAKRAAEVMRKADSKTFADLAIVDVGNGQQVMATKTFLAAASRLQPDAIDNNVVGKQSLGKFRIALPAGSTVPYATRGFYGIFDITQAAPTAGARVAGGAPDSWENILRRRFPNMIGCFDPEILKVIRANFVTLDKRFTVLDVVEVPGGAMVGATQGF